MEHGRAVDLLFLAMYLAVILLLVTHAFCWVDIDLPEQAGYPRQGLGLVIEDRPTELPCSMVVTYMQLVS